MTPINYTFTRPKDSLVSTNPLCKPARKDKESLKDQKGKPYPRRTSLLVVKGACQLSVATLPARFARYASARLRRFAPDAFVDPCTCDGC